MFQQSLHCTAVPTCCSSDFLVTLDTTVRILTTGLWLHYTHSKGQQILWIPYGNLAILVFRLTYKYCTDLVNSSFVAGEYCHKRVNIHISYMLLEQRAFQIMVLEHLTKIFFRLWMVQDRKLWSRTIGPKKLYPLDLMLQPFVIRWAIRFS